MLYAMNVMANVKDKANSVVTMVAAEFAKIPSPQIQGETIQGVLFYHLVRLASVLKPATTVKIVDRSAVPMVVAMSVRIQ